MTLTPSNPPGRSTRKALAFEADIGRLHRLGYSFEAIRRALAEAGVHVSRSTVQREVARHSARTPPAQGQGQLQPASSPTGPPVDAPMSNEFRSGKELAAEFMKGRVTNPLFRNRS